MAELRPSVPGTRFEELTPGHREVRQLLAKGRTNFEIAEALGISLEGAKYHVREIMGRSGSNRAKTQQRGGTPNEGHWRGPGGHSGGCFRALRWLLVVRRCWRPQP